MGNELVYGVKAIDGSYFRRPYGTRLVANVAVQALKCLPTLRRPYGTRLVANVACRR